MKFKALSNSKRSIQQTLNWIAINAYTSKWKSDTWFDIEIKRKTAKKSDPQRAYYFGVVNKIYAHELGYEIHEYYQFHCWLKHRYFSYYFQHVKPDKTKVPYIDDKGIIRNIPDLFADDSEFDVKFKADFIDWVVRRASVEDNIYIPDSNE